MGDVYCTSAMHTQGMLSNLPCIIFLVSDEQRSDDKAKQPKFPFKMWMLDWDRRSADLPFAQVGALFAL